MRNTPTRLTTQSIAALLVFVVCTGITFADVTTTSDDDLRVGIIGLDTSHVIAFTNLLNSESPPAELRGCRVVAAYPYGSRDIKSNTSRIPAYTEQIRELGVEIVDSIETLVGRVDAVLLETNDGRLHWEQALPVLRAGKPVFIDKPMAASLADVIAIFEAADHFGTPVFSASSLRYGPDTLAVRNGSIGEVYGCDTFSPCDLEPTHPDLFWYGIHGVESLFTVMGTGCREVRRISTPDADVVIGTWEDGRIGTFRGMRKGARDYGGTAFGKKSTQAVGKNAGYEPLLQDIIRFFRTGKSSIDPEETIEIFAFMQAAQKSKELAGKPVTLESVLSEAREEAAKKRTW